MAGNPYNSPFTTTGTLSSYFEKEKAKGTKAGGASPYSAPVDVGGAPAGGAGPSAPASAPSAPKGSAGGGSGFVSFGQYFGANAPAIQAQAQQAVSKAAMPQGASKAVRAGQSPYEQQIAQTSAQFAALNPAAQSGDMGENVSAFDQLLGGGLTQRAAKQEQQRLGALRSALEGEQSQWQAEQAARKEAQARQQTQTTKARQQEQEQAQRVQEAALTAAKDLAWENMAPWNKVGNSKESWWNSLSDEEKQKYLDQTTQGRGTGQFGEAEYASSSQ